MQIPLDIVFEGIGHSDFIESHLRDEAEKLEQFSDRITSAKIVVSQPHRKHEKGNIYQVRIYMTLPGGGNIVVNREPGDKNAHEDAYVAIRDAFQAARRQLQDQVRKRQGKTKLHETPPHGTIATMVSYEGYGFISSADGREIYFHRNSVANDAFDRLQEGQEVRFTESQGDKGPQASFVKPIGKHHID